MFRNLSSSQKLGINFSQTLWAAESVAATYNSRVLQSFTEADFFPARLEDLLSLIRWWNSQVEAFQATNEVLDFPTPCVSQTDVDRFMKRSGAAQNGRRESQTERVGSVSVSLTAHIGGWKYIWCWKIIVFLPVLQSRYRAVERFCDRTRIGSWQAVFLGSLCCFDIVSLQYSFPVGTLHLLSGRGF